MKKVLILMFMVVSIAVKSQTNTDFIRHINASQTVVNMFVEREFKARRIKFDVPVVSAFDKLNPIRTACGIEQNVNCSYCPADNSINVSLDLYKDFFKRFGEFSLYAVMSHEYGHLIQKQFPSKVNDLGLSVLIELKSDCISGVFFNFLNQARPLNLTQFNAAQVALFSLGDDVTSMSELLKSDSHGANIHRANAFDLGYKTGSIETCYSHYSEKIAYKFNDN